MDRYKTVLPQSCVPLANERVPSAAMLFLAAGFWLLVRPYAGVSQDALLYSFQAFARLHPESLGGDIFLANTSQDSYTVFPAIHAAAIRSWGVETAAWVLTLAGQAWWFAAATALAWQLVGPRFAGLSIALLAALPGYYGAYEVFRYAEPFVTSRLFSEALVLTGLALLLSGRRAWALCATLAALLVHPLMGVAGLLLVAAVLAGRRGPVVVSAAVIAGIALSVAVASTHPIYPLATFDREWLELARSRSPFLLAQDWNAETWAAVARTMALATLAGMAWGPSGGRRLLVCSTIVALSGLAITLTGASMAHVVLLVQGQSWRWLWLVQVLAVVAVPWAFHNLWAGGATARGAVLLAVAGWLVTGWPAVLFSLLAVALAGLGRMPGKAAERWAFLSGLTVLATCIIAYASVLTSGFDSITRVVGGSAWRADGVLPVACVVTSWFALQRESLKNVALAVTPVLGVVAAFIAVSGWDRQALVSQEERAAFSAWRTSIPVDAEVYWPQHVDVTWFVLQRRSYLSHLQTAGALFSRDTAMEQLARTAYTSPGLPASIVFGDGAAGVAFPLDEVGIGKVCRIGGADYVVSTIPTPFPDAAPPVSARLRPRQVKEEFRLLDCTRIRGSGGATG